MKKEIKVGKLNITYNSPVIITFMLISFVVLIISYITHQKSDMLLFSVYRSSLLNPLFYLRLFTHVLGHQGISHFVGNFMVILMIGPMLEEKYGSDRMLVMILFTAFVTGLINVIFFPNTALLGASGIAFMMIVLSSMAGMRDGKVPLTTIVILVIYLGGEIVNGLFRKDNISQLSHVIGGLCGGEFGFLLPMRRGKR